MTSRTNRAMDYSTCVLQRQLRSGICGGASANAWLIYGRIDGLKAQARQPEPGTLEALLTRLPEPALFIPTHKGHGLPASEIALLPTRSGSMNNPTYAALTPETLPASIGWPSSIQRHTTVVGRRCHKGVARKKS
jgi:hypothetical protein